MNKKAGIPDGIFYLVAIFAVSIIFVVANLAFTEINDEFQSSNAISSQGKSMMSDLKGKYVGIIDSAFLLIFAGILLGTIVGVWFIKTHPALFWIMIPIFAFIIFLSAIYANVYWNFTHTTQIEASASQFTIMPFILENYAYVMTGVVILLAIALFAKGKSDQPL